MMNDRETLRALIERVEKATGPDSRLDEDIEAALGWPFALATGKARPFTSSLDAAASLVPPMKWFLERHTRLCFAVIGSLRSYRSDAAPPPLALTAAALRARLAEMEGNNGSEPQGGE